jgi:hypothetical protein
MDPHMVLGVGTGTWPDWIAAFGTSIAAIGTILVLNREVQARREEKAAERTYQARRVLCWLVDRGKESPTDPRLTVMIRNGSELPIFDCRILVEVDPAAGIQRTQPGELASHDVELEENRHLTFHEDMIPPGDHPRPLPVPGAFRAGSSATLLFTDTNGQRWSRDSRGRRNPA